jgi:peptidoglycan/xylan/chitin deacetylase (PgdA/CDA1 family)
MTLAALQPALAFSAGIPLAAAAACAAATYTFVAPRSTFWGPVIHRGDDSRPRYALTFDDGPTPDSTARILDTLGELNAPAAFFVIGRNVERAPDLVRRMHDEGHVVANHSYDHSHFGTLRLGWYWDRQFLRTDAAVREIVGRKPALFRPPMGARQGHIMSAARRHGHTVVTWSRRGLDGITTTADRIVNRLAPVTRAGDILILHDGVEPNLRRDPAGTVAAIRPLIQTLRDRGLEPARLDELIDVSPYAPAAPSPAGAPA